MPIITINLHLYHVAGVKRVAVGEVCFEHGGGAGAGTVACVQVGVGV